MAEPTIRVGVNVFSAAQVNGPPLFCVADEAKPFVRKFMEFATPADARCVRFVASRSRPNSPHELKLELDDGAIDSDFIGAPYEDCQQWAREVGSQLNYVEDTFLFIADARSAEDDTISVQHYAMHQVHTYSKFGPLPPVTNKWYEWRVNYRDAFQIYGHLAWGIIILREPIYFGLKDELTDERGVFDSAEAKTLYWNKDMERLGEAVIWDGVGPSL